MMYISIVMDDLLYQTFLFDFYGELLTAHQREVYEDYLCNDLSESEIAKEAGISRQAAHDMIKRCQKSLKEYEDKLHLVERFLNIKNRISEIKEISDDPEIGKIVDQIIEEL